MKANHIVKHDYISVYAIDAAKERINLTVSWGGAKATAKVGSAHFKVVSDAYMALEKACHDAKVPAGQMMEEVKAMADESTGFEDFAQRLAIKASVRRLAASASTK